MSKGFVKEEDQEETPLVTPRAHLPVGVVNYVTSNGLEELRQEQNQLLEEQKSLIAQSPETNRVQINYIATKLHLLEDRISTAKLADHTTQPKNEIHFGASVKIYKQEENCVSQYQIVGVDEANISLNKISFLSPLAKLLQNKKVGDIINLQTPKGVRIMKIEAIDY